MDLANAGSASGDVRATDRAEGPGDQLCHPAECRGHSAGSLVRERIFNRSRRVTRAAVISGCTVHSAQRG